MSSQEGSPEEWHHARWFEPHAAAPDLAKAYISRCRGKVEAPCLTCVNGEVVIRAASTVREEKP